jgi:hypothetical protein
MIATEAQRKGKDERGMMNDELKSILFTSAFRVPTSSFLCASVATF